VTFGARPKPAAIIDPVAAEAFVASGVEQLAAAPAPAPEQVKPKQLTIVLDPLLHKKLKTRTSEEDTTIADVARKLLQERAYR
jgi:hypothetical protein